MTSVTINRTSLRALLPLAAKDDIRRYLNGVAFEIDANVVRLIATDGRCMGILRHGLAEEEREEGRSLTVIVPRDVCERAAKRNAIDRIRLECAEGEAWSIVDCESRVTFKPLEGTFPDWRRVVPTKVTGIASPINPELLGGFVKSAHALSSKRAIVSVAHNGSVDDEGNSTGAGAALVRISCSSDFVGVVMPMRDEPCLAAPAWISEPRIAEPVAEPAADDIPAEEHVPLAIAA